MSAAYRARFIEPQRIAAGVAFWRDNEAWLREAQDRWGVPAEIVFGIVGVEIFYGRITGNRSVGRPGEGGQTQAGGTRSD